MRKVVAVVGSTGVLGKPLVEILNHRPGVEVRELARRAKGERAYRVDLNRGEGLDEALRGVDTVYHLASAARSGRFAEDIEQTKRLSEAARRAGVPHFVYVSIVGIDRIPYPYYKVKLTCERVVEQSGLNYTIVRATQFHELVDEVLRRAHRWGAVWIPKRFRFQTADARSVAGYLAGFVSRHPERGILNIGGSEVFTLGEMARAWMNVRRISQPVVGIPTFGRVAKGFRKGYNTTRHALPDSMSWEEWLVRKYE